MQKHKVCSFFGHRKINATQELMQTIKAVIKNLIIKHNVSVFLFGSRSEFDYLCHYVVTELKVEYPEIKRVTYTCKSESCVLESERITLEKIYESFKKDGEKILGVEEEFEHETKFKAGKASYVERNQAMIDNSDYCVFYYNKNYVPENKRTKGSNSFSKPKSGTALAYKYAQKKCKKIINIFNN